jgi:O-antigen/teichoic acid export membrane protein
VPIDRRCRCFRDVPKATEVSLHKHVSLSDARDGAATSNLVVRNTLYLGASQVVTVPLAILSNAMAAHYLGAEVFGYAYLAGTLCGFGFLAVGWGHEAVLPAVVARDRSHAGLALGSSLAWRAGMAVVVYIILAFACSMLKYPAELQWALALTSLLSVLTLFIAAVKDTIRGLERTDIPAYVHVGQQVLATALVAAALMLGGQLRACLLAQAVACVVVLATLWPTLRPVGVGALSVRSATIKALFHGGTPFVFYGIAMALQPNIDVMFLSKMAPLEVMGWYAVSRKLMGCLLLPATALIGALYPTLCRLHATDVENFRRTTNAALRSIALLVVPVALGSALFPEIGVALFSRQYFRPAEDNLRIMAVLLALVYFSMPLGTCVMAAGKQRAWSMVQVLCVVTSLVLDPLLVPVFQRRTGNGGLGLCVAGVISEGMVIAFGLALAPRGVLDQKLGRLLVVAMGSGVAMTVVALVAKPLGPLVSAPASLLAYGGAMWSTGGLDRDHVATVKAALGFSRFRPSS